MGISRAEALDSLRSDDLLGIGMEADAVRQRLHPEGVVSYAVVCGVDCSGGDVTRLREQARQRLSAGGSGLVLTGTAGLSFEQLLGVVRELRSADGGAWISGLDAAEVSRLAAATGSDAAQVFARLGEAGWNGLGLDAAGPALGREDFAQWLGVHRAAHRAGLRTVAGMRFGGGEDAAERIEFLEQIRILQNETGGFAAFAPETAGGGLHGPTAVECLKVIAVSRLLLENVATIEAGRATGSLKVLETMLRFGADDAGEVLVASSTEPDLREEDLRRVIRDAGLAPVERDPAYRMVFVG